MLTLEFTVMPAVNLRHKIYYGKNSAAVLRYDVSSSVDDDTPDKNNQRSLLRLRTNVIRKYFGKSNGITALNMWRQTNRASGLVV